MTPTKTKVNVKYKTKNIKTECKELFLATINQTNASISSRRNFNVTATSVCIVWLSGCLLLPLKNIIIEIEVITAKVVERIIISDSLRSSHPCAIKKHPVKIVRIFSVAMTIRFLITGFITEYYLIKSLTAVYIAAKTPSRDRITVNRGNSEGVNLSSSIPPQVVSRIITTI